MQTQHFFSFKFSSKREKHLCFLEKRLTIKKKSRSTNKHTHIDMNVEIIYFIYFFGTLIVSKPIDMPIIRAKCIIVFWKYAIKVKSDHLRGLHIDTTLYVQLFKFYVYTCIVFSRCTCTKLNWVVCVFVCICVCFNLNESNGNNLTWKCSRGCKGVAIRGRIMRIWEINKNKTWKVISSEGIYIFNFIFTKIYIFYLPSKLKFTSFDLFHCLLFIIQSL